MHSESERNTFCIFYNFSMEQYKHEIVFCFFHLSTCFKSKFAYLSIGHSYLQDFSSVIFLKVAKIYFLLCKIILVHFTCIPSFIVIWLSLSDYSEWKIRKEKHSIFYAVTQNPLTL